MNKRNKLFLGILTFLPIIYILFFLFPFIFISISSFNNKNFGPRIENYFPSLFILHILVMLILFSLFIVYLLNIFKNENLDQTQKLLWALLIFVGNVIAMVAYYFIYIFPEIKES